VNESVSFLFVAPLHTAAGFSRLSLQSAPEAARLGAWSASPLIESWTAGALACEQYCERKLPNIQN
jgi:hypothetical protein